MPTKDENDSPTASARASRPANCCAATGCPSPPRRAKRRQPPTRFVRVLGEDLVLFRDKSGRVGLLADTAPTAAPRCCTAASRSEASPAPTTAGSTTPAATSWRRRPSATTPSSTTSSSRPIRCRSSSACTGPTSARCPRRSIAPLRRWVRTDGHRRSTSSRSSTATGCRRWRTRSILPTCRSCTRSSSAAAASRRTPRAASPTT